MRLVPVRGGAIHVAERGPQGGAVVVFLNSLGTDLRVWAEVVEALPDVRSICMDKRGHGQSTEAADVRTIAAHAADVAEVLDRLGVSSALVVGLSIGGMIAEALAVARPDLVAGLVLLDTAHRIGTQASWAERIERVRTGGMDAIADGVIARWFSPSFAAAKPAEISLWKRRLAETPAEGYIAACEAIRDADLTAIAPRIRAPAWFAAGSDDIVTPPDLVRDAAALVPGARFQILPGVGHLPPVERPGLVVDLIRSALGEIDRPGDKASG
jgi:3-oxoadipate enol-lactonase